MKIKVSMVALSCCLVLLVSSVFHVDCAIGDYSETRSFRDALDGRSMEEAISGPVDRDTSSYGDRTSSSTSGSNSNGSNYGNSNYGASNNGNGSGAMMTIPANGNLNPPEQQEQTVPEQQQDQAGAEEPQQRVGPMAMATPDNGLEREAETIGDSSPQTNGELRRSKNKMLPLKRQRAPLNARSMMNGRQAQMPAQSYRQDKAQFQRQTQMSEMPANGNEFPTKEASFGEEPATRQMMQPRDQGRGGYGSRSGGDNYSGQDQQRASNGADSTSAYGGQENQSSNSEPREQQPQQQQQTDISNGNLAKPQQSARSMVPMMNGNNPMRAALMGQPKSQSYGSRGQQQQQPQGINMNNGGAYSNSPAMSNENGQRQRQSAPPMMMMMMMTPQQAAAAIESSGASTPPALSSLIGGQNGNRMSSGSRPMRRANQRRPVERKMSPAMVNAMLNKMINAKQQQQQQEENVGYNDNMNNKPMTNYNGNGNGNGAEMNGRYGQAMPIAMLMRTPAGAEMLANMIMEQQQIQEPQKEIQMSPAKRDEYKRMMMAAIMQQATQMTQANQMSSGEYGNREQQTGSMGNNYQNGIKPQVPMSGGSNGYSSNGNRMSEQQQVQSANGEDSLGRQMDMMSKAQVNGARGYNKNSNNNPLMAMRQMQPMNGYSNSRAPSMLSKMSRKNGPNGGQSYGQERGMEQQQQEHQEQEQQRELSSGTKSAEAQSTSTKSPMNMGEQQQEQQDQEQVMTPVRQMEAQLPMNGFRQAYNQQENNLNQQQQMQTTQQDSEYSSKGSMGSEGEQEREYGAAPIGQAEPFAFDYKVEDNYGNGHYRKEEGNKDGVVRGSYGYRDVSGIYRHVEYVADENGFRANIKSNEPGLNGADSGNGQSGGRQGSDSDEPRMNNNSNSNSNNNNNNNNNYMMANGMDDMNNGATYKMGANGGANNNNNNNNNIGYNSMDQNDQQQQQQQQQQQELPNIAS